MHFTNIFTILTVTASLVSFATAKDLQHSHSRYKRGQPIFCQNTQNDCSSGSQINYSCCVKALDDSGAPFSTTCHDTYVNNNVKCAQTFSITQYSNGYTQAYATSDSDGCEEQACCDGIYAAYTGYSKEAGAENAATCVQATQAQITAYETQVDINNGY